MMAIDPRAASWMESVSVIPVQARGKKPLIDWKEYQTRIATKEERSDWKKRFPGCNVGLVTGAVSGLVALDFDGEEGKSLRKIWNLYGTPASITSKGFHTLHLHPGHPVPNAAGLVKGLDIRGDGGYIVIPPSVHESGHVYKWEVPPWMTELPPLPEAAVELLNRPAAQPGQPQAAAPGLPPGVGQGQRNAEAAKIAGRYLAKGLHPEEVWPILRAWNLANSPPLPEEELRSVLFSIARKEQDKGPIIEVVSFHDLATRATQSTQMTIAPFLPAGGKGILAGTGGVGKTMLGLNIAIDVAQELPVFGRFQPAKGSVLYVDAESTEALTYQRMRKICSGKHVPSGGVNFIFPKTKLDLGTERGRDVLSKKIEECQASLVLLDSFLCFASLRNENDNVEVRNHLESLNPIANRTGASILILDHAAKASAERAKAGISVTARGAGSKRDWCDVMITFEEKKNDAKFLRVLRFDKTRFCTPIPGITLEMDHHFVFRPVDEDSLCPLFAIRQAVNDTPGIGATKLYGLLSSTIGCSERTAMRAVADAVKLGHIRRGEEGRRVTFRPVLVTNGSVTCPEGDDSGEEDHLVYQ
jgi:hypothetical protein